LLRRAFIRFGKMHAVKRRNRGAVAHRISFEPVAVLIDEDGDEARLVLVDGKLTAVVALLRSDVHAPEDRGRWHVEAGFGPCAFVAGAGVFDSLDAVKAWVERSVAEDAARRGA